MAAAVAAVAMAAIAAAAEGQAHLLGVAELPGSCGSNGGSSGGRERCWCACALLLAACWALQGHSLCGMTGPGGVTAAGVPLVGAVTAIHVIYSPKLCGSLSVMLAVLLCSDLTLQLRNALGTASTVVKGLLWLHSEYLSLQFLGATQPVC